MVTEGEQPRPEDWRPMLQARPVCNRAAACERRPEGLRVTVRKHRPAYLVPPLSWILRPRLQVSYDLDELGGFVWEHCDGRHSVEDVVVAFADAHGLRFHEARVSVVTYLKNLVERGAIVLLIRDPEAPADTQHSPAEVSNVAEH